MPLIDPPNGCPALGEIIEIGRWNPVGNLTVAGMRARVDAYRQMSDGRSIWCEMTLTEPAVDNEGTEFEAWSEKVC